MDTNLKMAIVYTPVGKHYFSYGTSQDYKSDIYIYI